MTLITSQTLREAPRMSDRIAKQDITEKNSLGQTVVLVAAGQPIPDGVEVPKSQTEAKKVDAPPENKARRSRSTKAKGK
jgi:hypothetical protein